MRTAIVDYGTGNLGSLIRVLEELDAAPVMVRTPADLTENDRLILPGVGNFTDCMDSLTAGGWVEPLRHAALENKQPFLGICVGMQLLAAFGDEGAQDDAGTEGLGLIGGRVRHLRSLACTNRIPHVGWNAITPARADEVLLDGVPSGTDFYFTHSFAFDAETPDAVIATADYGISVTAAVRHDNVWGTQFHPEKSSRAGFRILKNFLAIARC